MRVAAGTSPAPLRRRHGAAAGDAGGGRALATGGEVHLTPLPPLQTGGDTGGIGGPLPAPRRAAPQVPPHPDPARPAAHHQAAAVVGNGGGGGGGGGGGSGGSSYASATAAWEPDCTSPGVGGGGSTGGGRGSSQYQHLHPHPYPPAPHRSRASAHPEPDLLASLLTFCFYCSHCPPA